MSIPSAVETFSTGYFEFKLQIGDWTGADEELLHVHVGLAIFVLVSLVLKKKFRSPVPLGFVIFFALLNELIDWMHELPADKLQSVWDIANTVLWPAVLFILARRWRP